MHGCAKHDITEIRTWVNQVNQRNYSKSWITDWLDSNCSTKDTKSFRGSIAIENSDLGAILRSCGRSMDRQCHLQTALFFRFRNSILLSLLVQTNVWIANKSLLFSVTPRWWWTLMFCTVGEGRDVHPERKWGGLYYVFELKNRATKSKL